MGRLQLQQELLKLAPKAWYQKPSTTKMSYPCFVYKALEPETVRADNRMYILMPKYEILYISQTEDDGIWNRMANTFEYLSIGRKYVSDNLYHYPFTVNYQ